MKFKTLTVMVAAGLLAAGTALAQNGPGPRGQGKGYGGPPQSEEERAARQEACPARNGEICPQGGPCERGLRDGQGQGNQYRRGARDGTGPRAGTDACPVNPGPAQK